MPQERGEGGNFADGLVGVVLDGRYRLDAVLGEGGMGSVFRAHHLAMDRKVAVKLLKPHLTQDLAALQRFAREARSTLRVDSPHAVRVLDFGITPHEDYYMVLEYLDGRTVQRELDVDGPFAPARAIHIAKQVARALGAAHASGLVHRDIKPDNLLLMRVADDPDYTKVLDFGVAKLMEGAARSSRSALAITAAGMVFGTPEFMSPEQACGHPLDGRSDLYSLAATLFAMLTGRGLFAAGSPIEWLTAHVRTPPPHLADGLAELAPHAGLDAVLQRCLAKAPADRPQSAAELIDALTAVERGEPTAVAIGDAAALPKGRAVQTAFSQSAFIPALDVGTSAPSPIAARPAVSRRRGPWLALGGTAIVGVVAAAAVVAATRSVPHAPAARPRTADKVVAAVPAAPVPVDAAELAAPVGAGTPADAVASSPVPTRPPVPTGPAASQSSARRAEVARFLAEAEAAKRASNRIRWVSQADSALRLDPRNTRAKLLLAEGLIAYGDLEHGCKYLRELRANPTAVQLAQTSCAGN